MIARQRLTPRDVMAELKVSRTTAYRIIHECVHITRPLRKRATKTRLYGPRLGTPRSFFGPHVDFLLTVPRTMYILGS